MGRFGSSLAVALQNAGYEVLAIDKASDLIDTMATKVTHAVRVNATNEVALAKLGLSNVDVAVVAVAQSIQDSVMITILLKKLGVKYIVARADNELHGDILSSIGAHKIIFPEFDTALRSGPILTMKDVSDYIPLGNGAGVIKLKAPSYFVGKTLEDIGLGGVSISKSAGVVLMIQRGKEGIVNPPPHEVVSHVDVLIIAGNNVEIEQLMEKAEKAAAAAKAKEEKGA